MGEMSSVEKQIYRYHAEEHEPGLLLYVQLINLQTNQIQPRFEQFGRYGEPTSSITLVIPGLPK